MRTLLTILLIHSLVALASAQTAEVEAIRLKQQEGTYSATEYETGTPAGKPGPVSWDFNLGTGFSYMPGSGSGMFAYAAPTLTVPVSPKWSLHGGIMASYFAPVGFGSLPGEGHPMPGSFSTLSVFGAASYRMSDRLVIHGAGVKQLAATPLPTPVMPFSPYQSDRLSLGATYKLGNNVTIGATIHMQQGNGYYTSPFYW